VVEVRPICLNNQGIKKRPINGIKEKWWLITGSNHNLVFEFLGQALKISRCPARSIFRVTAGRDDLTETLLVCRWSVSGDLLRAHKAIGMRIVCA